MLAASILVAGWWLRPRDIPDSPPPVPSESELKELTRQTQRRSLDNITAYFAGLAADVSASLAYVPAADRTALAWDGEQTLTGPLSPPFDQGVVIRSASGERRADAVWSRRLPVSLLTSAWAPRPLPRAPVMPTMGQWLLAVWQTRDGPAFGATNFQQATASVCGPVEVRELAVTMRLTPAMVGGALFNLDRELVAVILPCGDRVAAIAPSSVDELVARAASVQERVLARHGLLLDALSAEERLQLPGVDGLVVREVSTGSTADAAGVQPGDVLERIDDVAIGGIDDVRPLVGTRGEPVTLQLRRGAKKKVTVTLTAAASQR